jgi:hypothetical protein
LAELVLTLSVSISVGESAVRPFGNVMFNVMFLTLALGIPAACAVAILKYRLYDIDIVISKTLVYTVLAGFITAVYVLLVVGVGSLAGHPGRPNLGLSILATALVAVAFQPVRARAQRLANRLVYGTRATPYQALSELSEQVGGTYATGELLPTMARIVAEATGALRTDVWLRSGGELTDGAWWPAEAASRPGLVLAGDALPAAPGGEAHGPGDPRRRAAGRAVGHEEARGYVHPYRGTAGRQPGHAGGAGAAQRRAVGAADGQAGRAARLARAAGHRAGPGAAAAGT